MNGLEMIKKRVSIRNFNNQDIDDEIIKEILEYGILSPSAHNKQPWYFVALKNNELKEQITDLMINKAVSLGKENSSIIHSAKIMKEASILVFVFNKYNEEHLISNTLSLGACIENILLAAAYYDIGSLWIRNTYIIENEIKELLDKNDMTLSSVIALGYTDQFKRVTSRIPLEQILEMRY